jgi:parvulin-like peptidyl-prolyl isomerase
MKKLLTSLAICATLSYAGLIDGVAITVDNEPITLYEIEKTKDRFKVNPSQAAEILIRSIIMEKAIKDTYVDYDFNEEVSHEIALRANKLNMSAKELKDRLTNGGFSWNDYREDIRRELTKVKFIEIIKRKRLISTPTEDEMLGFYNTNEEKFISAQEVDVVEYKSNSQKALEYIKTNPMATLDAVTSEKKRYNLSMMPALEPVISATKEGEFTQNMKVSRDSEEFISMFIVKKIGIKKLSFNEAKMKISQMIFESKSKKAMDDYIQKLKSEANIKIVR